MDLGLSGKLALVTGSTAGIGFATAEVLAREGARVILNGRTQARVDAAIAKLRQTVPAAQVSGIAADVSGAAGCAQVVKAHPDADILVNNMGIFEPKPFEEIDDSDWMRFFEANHQRAEFRLAQPLRHLAAQDPALGFGSQFAFAGDDQDEGQAIQVSPLQKARERVVRPRLRHPVQVEPGFDFLPSARQLGAFATSKRRQGRRRRLLRSGKAGSGM